MRHSNKSSIKTAGLFLAICAFFFVYFLLHGANKTQRLGIPFSKKPAMIASNVLPFKESTCEETRSIVYLKTHKTGSSTLMSILQRHKKRHAIGNQALKPVACPWPFCGGYPGYFRKDLAIYNKDFKPDILMGHFRFNGTMVKSLINRKAKYITLMRNPLKQFESAFYYYYGKYTQESLAKKEQSKSIVCHGHPYLQVTKKFGMSLSDYIKLVENAPFEQMSWYFRSQNFQSFDLGLDPWNSSQEYLLDETRRLNSVFDLVLINEHLLESLILLKELLCMDWSDIIPPKLNEGRYKAHNYTNIEVDIVRRLNSQDVTLYNFFNDTLWKKVEKYGKRRMENDVTTLKNLINIQKESKTEEKQFFEKKNTTRKRRNTNRLAHLMNTEEEMLLYAQNMRLDMNWSTVQELSKYMVKNSGWCPLTANYI